MIINHLRTVRPACLLPPQPKLQGIGARTLQVRVKWLRWEGVKWLKWRRDR